MCNHRFLWLIPSGALAAITVAPPVNAQDDADYIRMLERQMRELEGTSASGVPSDQPISERLLLDYGAITRFGFYSIDVPDGESRFLRQTSGTLYMRAELDGAHRVFGRLSFIYDDWNTGDGFSGEGDELAAPIGDRYWYQYDHRSAVKAQTGETTDFNVNVKAGRQFVHWGSGLTLSNELYAGLLDVELGGFGVTGLIGLTPSTGTVDFDGSRPGFDEDTDRAFFGGALEYRGWSSHRPYLFFLAQRDHNERDFRRFASPFGSVPTRFEYDSNYLGVGSRGSLGANWFYRIEGIYEWGDGLSNSFDDRTGLALAQTSEDIMAAAGVLGVTYVFRDAWNSRLDFELIGASGDDDRVDESDTFGGNRSGTDDNAFLSLGYVNTGLAVSPNPSNLLTFRTGLTTSPNFFGGRVDSLRLGVSAFLFNRIDGEAPVSIATDNDGSFVGGEVDVFFDWSVTSDVLLYARYGAFIPGRAVRDGEDDVRHFVAAGVSYAF